MKIVQLRLSGLLLIEPDVRRDERGFFVETYRRSAYGEAGIGAEFLQDNHSRSSRGTLRGLHFQSQPGQPKLIRCVRGKILDVVVDIRRSSPTFKQYESIELDDDTHRQLYVPAGFAHGFCVISDVADVAYKVGSYYNPTTEVGFAWDDPDVAIAWPVNLPQLSDRDRNQPRLRDILHLLPEL